MNKLFVYGTLMRGQKAEKKMTSATYLGNYRLADYAMYDLGAYPGIKKCKGECVVGELYEISEDMLPEFDRYEGEGSLYKRTKVVISRENDYEEAYAYVYLHKVFGEPMQERWNISDDDYVWYAGYGSNLNSERFANYILGGVYALTGKYCEGCRDKSLWIADCMKKYPGRMYFAKESKRWDNKGVSFYNPDYANSYTHMHLYKIKRSQLLDIQKHEWRSWYDRLLCIDILSDNCPVYTVTSRDVYEDNVPSEKYLYLIKDTLIDLLHEEPFAIDNYLVESSPKVGRILFRDLYNEDQTEVINESVCMVRYMSEVFAQNCPPVNPFRIVVEEKIEGNRHEIVVKKVIFSYENPEEIVGEGILSSDRWGDRCL